jgi:hypothetical protein
MFDADFEKLKESYEQASRLARLELRKPALKAAFSLESVPGPALLHMTPAAFYRASFGPDAEFTSGL